MASEKERFLRWWKDTPGFDLCTLEQAIGAYLATYPGRVLPLVISLLKRHDGDEPMIGFNEFMREANCARVAPDACYESYKLSVQSIEAYWRNGLPPGGFIEAVLCNDLKEAFGRADLGNRFALFAIVSYCYNNIPGSVWGSREKFSATMDLSREQRAALVAGSEFPECPPVLRDPEEASHEAGS